MLLAIKQEIQEADQLGAQASSSTPKLGGNQLKELESGLPESPSGKRPQSDLVSMRLKAPLDRLKE